MRIVAAFVLVGCTSHYGDLTIQPPPGAPLGVGLVERFTILQDVCDDTPPDPGGCDPSNPSHAVVAIRGGAAKLAAATNSSFDLVGAAPGSAMIDVTGDAGATATMAIDVADVASTTLFVRRLSDDQTTMFSDVHDPVQAFWSSTVVIEQRILGDADRALAGSIALQLDPHGTDVAYGEQCDCYGTGFYLGAATLSSPLASLTLNVVDESAIADFTVDESPTATVLQLHPGTSAEVFLIPTDAAGRPIVGRGRDPQIVIADPSIATVYSDTGNVIRGLQLLGEKAGVTRMDVTWGSVHKTFTLRVATS